MLAWKSVIVTLFWIYGIINLLCYLVYEIESQLLLTETQYELMKIKILSVSRLPIEAILEDEMFDYVGSHIQISEVIFMLDLLE